MAEARRKAELDKHTALHARSIREAVEMASDGDKILLLRGIHNGAGETVCVTKRVWIKGEGALKEATIDMRANSPTFRITRSCVVSNVDFDFSGFAESLRIAQMERGNILNKRQYETLIEGCSFSCTGCDGLVVTDKAKATFRNCDITGKNNCARLSREADATFIDCKIHGGERRCLRHRQRHVYHSRLCRRKYQRRSNRRHPERGMLHPLQHYPSRMQGPRRRLF